MNKLLKKNFVRRDGVEINITLKYNTPKNITLSNAKYNIKDSSTKRYKALQKVIKSRGKQYVKKQLEKKLSKVSKDDKKKIKIDIRKI